MAWSYAAPQRCDFDSEEDYQDAMVYYENAADMYAEEYLDSVRG